MNRPEQELPLDWGPEGEPIFQDPDAQALRRVAVIDVGSNSVRLVVFDGAARSPAYFFNEKLMCALGAGLADTGHLNPEGRQRALQALHRFTTLAEAMGATPIHTVATAAVREAKDGPEFIEEVEDLTGLRLRVIDGLEEARLSAQGVLLGWPGAEGLMCDIGGSSMELAVLKGGEIGDCVTSPLGPLKLKDIEDPEELRTYVTGIIDDLAKAVGDLHDRIYLVGGSWRAIAKLDMMRRGYPLTVLHEYSLTRTQVAETIEWILGQDNEALRSQAGISPERMTLVPIACMVLEILLERFDTKEVFISSYGIREGMLYEQMPDPIRQRDPLIEACRFAEATTARLPGFGRQLYHFVRPLFPKERWRLVKAACLLHDTAWRAHPDYRHEVCFDNATRANLGGLDHQGRVFLGLALLHRYKNNRADSRFDPLFTLLNEDQIQEAEILGKAMRFGAMFSSQAPQELIALRLDPVKTLLTLTLSKPAIPLFGEVAEARLTSLAKSLNVKTEVIEG
ncbi:Ppx/GppA family phosphatase [Actibacterium pelagium]|uniref:Exopolyphosphatase n=1 Tax=Actibacterium pelagium TaxID=2029103 RepID=A0A917AGI8_9RHOB|nr:Ppx/GppA family phosphatase [Actibacterium pelagium]GGE49292.1 exopolyphosphatase [Actibacterium pelagium]